MHSPKTQSVFFPGFRNLLLFQPLQLSDSSRFMKHDLFLWEKGQGEIDRPINIAQGTAEARSRQSVVSVERVRGSSEGT